MTDSAAPSLRITEIFYSLQGEARDAGHPTVFVRLTGCPLRCVYCDSEYAFYGGEKITLDSILNQVAQYKTPYICVTGGEPLAQPNCIPLLESLCDRGYRVSLETSGAMDITPVDNRVSRVMDIKTPDSGEVAKNRYENIAVLTSHDQLKFVICSRSDYEWARAQLDQLKLPEDIPVWFSPSYSDVTPRELAEWIIDDQLPVRFQMQLHKQLWNDEPGR